MPQRSMKGLQMVDFRIRKAPGLWVVRSDGAVLAETRNALELDVPDRDPVIFFPREDIAMELLDVGTTTTPSPLGDTRAFALSSVSGTVADVAWSYDPPIETAAPVSGHLAFHDAKVAIERL